MFVVEKKVAKPEDVKMLKMAYIRRQAMFDIINEKTSPSDRDYEWFAYKNDEYKIAWELVLKRTFDTDYAKLGKFSWDCNFETGEVTVTG